MESNLNLPLDQLEDNSIVDLEESNNVVEKKPFNKKVFFLLLILLLLVVSFWGDDLISLVVKEDVNQPGPVSCTEEAKQCSDGSFVGRNGPDCEFEACPEVSEEPNFQNVEQIKDPFKIGKFEFNPDTSWVKRTRTIISYSSGQAVDSQELAEKHITEIDEDYPEESCTKIENFERIYTEVYGDYKMGAAPEFTMESWNNNNLKFESEEVKNAFDQHIILVEDNLEKLIDHEWLTAVISDQEKNKYGAIGFPGRYIYCSGGWAVPMLVEKVPSSEFEKVYYAEVNSGNGIIEQLPERKLIIIDGDDWLILSEQQDYELADGYEWENCVDLESFEDEASCVEKVTYNHRDEEANQEWVRRVLGVID